MTELNNLFGPELQGQTDNHVQALTDVFSSMNRETREEVDRVLAKAAICLAELCASFRPASSSVIDQMHLQVACLDESVALLREPDGKSPDAKSTTDTLRSIKVVGGYIPLIEESHVRVTNIMEVMLYTGSASRVGDLCIAQSKI